MFRQTPSGPTFTQTPLPCEPDPEDEPDPEPEPDWAGAVAEGVLAAKLTRVIGALPLNGTEPASARSPLRR